MIELRVEGRAWEGGGGGGARRGLSGHVENVEGDNGTNHVAVRVVEGPGVCVGNRYISM